MIRGETCHPNPAPSDIAEFIYVDPKQGDSCLRFPGPMGYNETKFFMPSSILLTPSGHIDERV
jgi:hypothetical protein